MVDVDFFSQVDCICDCESLSLGRCVVANLYFDKIYGVDVMSRIRAPQLVASAGGSSCNSEFAPWLIADAEDHVVVSKLDRLQSSCLRSVVEKIHPSVK